MNKDPYWVWGNTNDSNTSEKMLGLTSNLGNENRTPIKQFGIVLNREGYIVDSQTNCVGPLIMWIFKINTVV